MDRLQVGDPSQIGPFRLLGRLGEGGMGRVYLGQSPGGRKVAIKVVHPQNADDPEFRRRFAREVAAARQVGGFHTAAVVDADPGADPPWMATAYIPGPSLAEAIAQRGPLDEARVRELGAALAEGLAAIHDCGLIHRDLKPGNVILADDGPRIIDFGIAKGADATALTGSSALIGTLRYMSPEQLHAQELTTQSDVFALGTVLAYAATGHDPFAAPTIPAIINRIINDPPDLGLLTGDLRSIIGDCLAKDPGSRPRPGEILARFSHHGTHGQSVTGAPAPAPVAWPFPEAVPYPETRPPEAGAPAHAAQEPSRYGASSQPVHGGRHRSPEALHRGVGISSRSGLPPMSAAPARPTPNVDAVPPAPFSPVADPPFNDAVRQPTTHGADRLVGLAASRLKAAAVASAPLRRRSDDRYGVGDDDFDEDYGEPGRRRWPIVTAVLVLLVILLGAGVYGAWSYNQRQYYVGVHDGYVSIFRGTNQSVAGISLSSLLAPSTLKLSQLGANDQGTISQTISEGSLAGAQAGVNQLQLGADKCHAQWIALETWQAQSIRYQSELATAAASKPKTKVPPNANPGPMPAVPDTASCAPAPAFGIPASALPAQAGGTGAGVAEPSPSATP